MSKNRRAGENNYDSIVVRTSNPRYQLVEPTSRNESLISLRQTEIPRRRERDLEVAELLRLGLLGEQDVELDIGQALGFGEAVVAPQQAHEGRARPEEARLALPVPGGRVEHLGRDGVGEQADEVVGDSGDDGRLDAEPGRWDLGHERIAHLGREG